VSIYETFSACIKLVWKLVNAEFVWFQVFEGAYHQLHKESAEVKTETISLMKQWMIERL